MFINFSLFEKSNLLPSDLVFLAAIKNKEVEYLIKNLTESDYNRFKELSLVKHIKAKKKDEHPYISLRLEKKTEELLINLSFEGAVDEETEILVSWLINVFKSKSGGIIKNKTEIRRKCMWFKTITNITGNKLAVLLQCFIQDTYNEQDGLTVKEFMEQNPRGVLNNMLDNLFFSPTSVFDKHYTLDKSPLYNYFTDNQEYVENIWRQKNLIEE